MSIYCSIFSIDAEDHEIGCKRLIRLKRGQKAPRDKDGIASFVIAGGADDYAVDESRLCTCGSGPITYQHSGVLPADDNPRGGCFSLGAIPPHITRDGRDDRPENENWYPWLRVSIWGTPKDDPTVILTRKQVEKLRDALDDWLERSADPSGQQEDR